jgi:phosphatidate cytidylyltransferase
VPLSPPWKRVASAVVLLPLVVWLLLRGPAELFHALVIAMAGAATWELGRILERAPGAGAGWTGVALGMLVTASFAVEGGPVVALTLAVGVTLSAPVLSRRAPSTDATAARLFGLVYVSWLLGHAIWVRALPGGGELVLLLVGVTWIGESSAYAVGSLFGRHKLAPVVSPGKTVEGAVAQMVASVVAALALSPWLVPGWSFAQAVAAGLLLGVVGQVGDLAESVVKRSVGTKDTGALIPGHGGVLDRLDSLLFNAPAFFYFVTLAGGAP